MDSLALLQSLTSIPAPPGQESELAAHLAGLVRERGLCAETDAKGNLLVRFGKSKPRVVVTAHMDEIAMIVRGVEPDGCLRVGNMGGLYPWKLGEGPVEILSASGSIDGVLGFGSIHTDDPSSRVQQSREKPVSWMNARVFTGLPADKLGELGVRPGTRVVVARSRRNVLRLGDYVASYFLDDRADLVSWLLALERLSGADGIVFAATASEEVGGEGAQWLLHEVHPEVCIALELGPYVPDAPSELTSAPSVWVNDSYSATAAFDLDLVASVARNLGFSVQFQAFSRGGSDASCAASKGLCARPFTLGLPMENSHGFEIMHKDAMGCLADLTVGLVSHLVS